jgi:hypothetical protein
MPTLSKTLLNISVPNLASPPYRDTLPKVTLGVVNTQTDKCQLTTESNFNRSSGLDRQRTDVTKQVEALLGDGERHINCFRPRSTTNSSNHLSRFN